MHSSNPSEWIPLWTIYYKKKTIKSTNHKPHTRLFIGCQYIRYSMPYSYFAQHRTCRTCCKFHYDLPLEHGFHEYYELAQD